MPTSIFNLDKSLQVILYVAQGLLRKDFHKIFKIIYFADRNHLAKYGRSITGDMYIKMADGPVPSKIYDIFKAVRGDSFFTEDATRYAQLFDVHDWYFIQPKQAPDLDFLSASDIEALDSAIAQYGTLSWDEIRQKSHDIAWSLASDDAPISMENMLREAGEKEDYISYLNWITPLQPTVSQ
ncbi:MAG: SocA family protein [Prevotellaceae bacterium]|jgi:uncharacterized phage-associated protein|nr:SocA family protein [Prevotellaceae bacterium]